MALRILVCAALAAGFISGCGDACADLQPVCDLCADANQKAACEATVDRDNQSLCQQDIDNFKAICK